MSNLNNADEMLEVIGQVLIRCFVMGVLVLLFWLGALTLGGDFAYSVHAKIVPISREQFYVIHSHGFHSIPCRLPTSIWF
jgi:hypothetical protein